MTSTIMRFLTVFAFLAVFVPGIAKANCGETFSQAQYQDPVGCKSNPAYQKSAANTNTGGDVFNQSVTAAYSLACPVGSTFATVEAEIGAIRYRTDGTAATATVGVAWPLGSQITFNVSPLSNVSIIAQSGSTTTIDVECFK